MKLIAHRALTRGSDPSQENHPSLIKQVLNQGLDVEIDVWLVDNKWVLGHDTPQYQVDVSFLYQPGLWIHAKNWPAAEALNQYFNSLNYFWHKSDERVLTSGGYWWTYPGKALGPHSICVMPEWNTPLDQFSKLRNLPCYGICSDHVDVLT